MTETRALLGRLPGRSLAGSGRSAPPSRSIPRSGPSSYRSIPRSVLMPPSASRPGSPGGRHGHAPPERQIRGIAPNSSVVR
eukprot:1001560-Prorocentrum_minimum.AAC.1